MRCTNGTTCQLRPPSFDTTIAGSVPGRSCCWPAATHVDAVGHDTAESASRSAGTTASDQERPAFVVVMAPASPARPSNESPTATHVVAVGHATARRSTGVTGDAGARTDVSWPSCPRTMSVRPLTFGPGRTGWLGWLTPPTSTHDDVDVHAMPLSSAAAPSGKLARRHVAPASLDVTMPPATAAQKRGVVQVTAENAGVPVGTTSGDHRSPPSDVV